MTPIESIYEMESMLAGLREPMHAKSTFTAQRALKKYERLVDRFFRENVNFVEPDQRSYCLHDYDYFMTLMESTKESYYSGHENLP